MGAYENRMIQGVCWCKKKKKVVSQNCIVVTQKIFPKTLTDFPTIKVGYSFNHQTITHLL